jgi:hypothetical protein
MMSSGKPKFQLIAETLHPYMMIQTFHALLFNKNSDVNTDDDVIVLLEIFV